MNLLVTQCTSPLQQIENALTAVLPLLSEKDAQEPESSKTSSDESEKSRAPTESGISPELLTLIDSEKVFFASFWYDGAIKIQDNKLILSERLQNRITDAQLEKILKYCPPFFSNAARKYITFFDFSLCPKLGAQAPMIMLKYFPDAKRTSFQGLSSSRFHNHTLLVGEEKISINKEFVSHFSPYFKALFRFQESSNQSMDETTLKEFEAESVRDCVNALIGIYDVRKERLINRALSFAHTALHFQLTEFMGDSEAAIVEILDEIKKMNLKNLTEILSDINKQFYPYFQDGNFLRVAKKLSEMAMPSFEKNLIECFTKYSKSEIVAYLEEIQRKGIPCYGFRQLLGTVLIEKLFGEADKQQLIWAINEESGALFQKLYELDPTDELWQLGCAISYMPTFFFEGHKYHKIKQLFYSAIPNLSGSLKDMAYACLAEVYHEADQTTQAKRILQKAVYSQVKEDCVVSTIALAQLLIEENSKESRNRAYSLLYHCLYSEKEVSRWSFSPINERKLPSRLKDLATLYLQFLLVKQGFHITDRYHEFVIDKILKKAIREKTQDSLLMSTASRLFHHMGIMKGYSDGFEDFYKSLLDPIKEKNCLLTMTCSPFFHLLEKLMDEVLQQSMIKVDKPEVGLEIENMLGKVFLLLKENSNKSTASGYSLLCASLENTRTKRTEYWFWNRPGVSHLEMLVEVYFQFLLVNKGFPIAGYSHMVEGLTDKMINYRSDVRSLPIETSMQLLHHICVMEGYSSNLFEFVHTLKDQTQVLAIKAMIEQSRFSYLAEEALEVVGL